MTDQIYVLLIDGRPCRKDNAIETYRAPEFAEKEAQSLARCWGYPDRKLAVATFKADIITEVVPNDDAA